VVERSEYAFDEISTLPVKDGFRILPPLLDPGDLIANAPFAHDLEPIWKGDLLLLLCHKTDFPLLANTAPRTAGELVNEDASVGDTKRRNRRIDMTLRTQRELPAA
jgi:hypothetical protein